MRVTIITTALALVISLAVCFFSLIFVQNVVYEMEDLCMRAIDAVNAGDTEAGKEQMMHIATAWEHHEPWLALVCDHEDLHGVKELFVEATINLECDHLDDYHKAMALREEALTHLRDQEPPKLSNIL